MDLSQLQREASCKLGKPKWDDSVSRTTFSVSVVPWVGRSPNLWRVPGGPRRTDCNRCCPTRADGTPASLRQCTNPLPYSRSLQQAQFATTYNLCINPILIPP